MTGTRISCANFLKELEFSPFQFSMDTENLSSDTVIAEIPISTIPSKEVFVLEDISALSASSTAGKIFSSTTTPSLSSSWKSQIAISAFCNFCLALSSRAMKKLFISIHTSSGYLVVKGPSFDSLPKTSFCKIFGREASTLTCFVDKDAFCIPSALMFLREERCSRFCRKRNPGALTEDLSHPGALVSVPPAAWASSHLCHCWPLKRPWQKV